MSKKLLSVGAILALVAAVFVGVASTASAQSMSLCQTVDALVAAGVIAPDKVAAAKAAAGCGSTTSSACYSFTKDLTVGSTGADVSALQAKLSVSPATGYFGAITKAAVQAYQTSKGISATGYVGPLTRQALNACVVVPSTPAVNPSTPSSSLSGGAGDLTVTEKSSGTDDEVREGEEGVKVLAADLEADGSDIEVRNVKIELTASSSGSTRITRYIDSVEVMLDGKVVGSEDTSDFTKNGTVYSKSISLDGAVVSENDTARLYIALNAANNIDSSDLDNTVEVDLISTRYEDADGVVSTDTTNIDSVVSFTDLTSSGDVSLTVSENDSRDNDTVSVDDTSDTNEVDILNFTVKAKGSDITLLSIPFTVVSSGAGVTEIANDFRLLMDGDEVGTISATFASSTATTSTFTVSDLDDDDVIIEAGDTVEFTLQADINDVDGAFGSGDKFSSVSVGVASISAEDENGDSVASGDKKGSADTTNLAFQSTGVTVTTASTENDTQEVNVESTATDNTGSFEIVYDVKAVEDDAFVKTGTAARGTTLSTNGANFTITDNATGVATTTGSVVLADVTRVSGGSVNGDYVKIPAGQSAKFKLNVTFDPAHATGTISYRVALYSVNFTATENNPTEQQVLTPESDYRTGYTPIAN